MLRILLFLILLMAKKKRGRKKATDPKLEVRFWLEASAIEYNGGMDRFIEKCIANAKTIGC